MCMFSVQTVYTVILRINVDMGSLLARGTHAHLTNSRFTYNVYAQWSVYNSEPIKQDKVADFKNLVL